MDNISYLLAGLVVFGFTVHGLLSRFDKSARRFPWCYRCRESMFEIPLPKVLPYEVRWHLMRHDLPDAVVSVYMCPKRRHLLWYVPKFSKTEKAFFLREEL